MSRVLHTFGKLPSVAHIFSIILYNRAYIPSVRAAADAIIAVTFYGDVAPESFGTFARGFVAMFRIMIGRWGAARGPRTRDTDRPRCWRASGPALNLASGSARRCRSSCLRVCLWRARFRADFGLNGGFCGEGGVWFD